MRGDGVAPLQVATSASVGPSAKQEDPQLERAAPQLLQGPHVAADQLCDHPQRLQPQGRQQEAHAQQAPNLARQEGPA